MKCFNHDKENAIGLCKHCNKGLCKECSTDLEYGLACKDKHEKEVETINMIIARNAKMYSSKKQYYLAPLLYLFLGIVFAGYGYPSLSNNVIPISFISGIGMLIFSVMLFLHGRSISNTKDKV